MELKVVKCPLCGVEGKLRQIEEGGQTLWHCVYCGSKFTDDSSERAYEKLQSTIQSNLGSAINEALLREKTEEYYNLRSMLWEKVHAEYKDSSAIVDICRDIKKINPHDFLAEFFELANSGTDAEIAEYIQNIDVKENELFIDLVLEFLFASLKEAYVTPVSLLLERAGSIFTPEKRQKYLTQYESEAAKVQSGLYEVGIPRDVFLAYSGKDMDAVVQILNKIEATGLTCFAAFRNMQHGRDAVANYDKLLYEAMDNCSIFVFVSSENSRSFSCDALKKEIAYIKNSEMKNFPEYRSYEQLPDKYKKLRIEYRLDNKPTPLADGALRQFFSGLTYAETFDQLLARLGEYMIVLKTPSTETKSVTTSQPTSQGSAAWDSNIAASLATPAQSSYSSAGYSYKLEYNLPGYDAAKTTGKKTLANGDVYEGNLRADVPNGKGKIVYAAGGSYEGDFRDGKRYGKGIYRYADGNVYDGEFRDDKFNGKGRESLVNGDVYEGEFKDGLRHGKGKYVHSVGGVYEGEFVAGKRCGKGKFTYQNGDVYQGEFRDGVPNGKGVYTYRNGAKENHVYNNGRLVHSEKRFF